MNLKSRKCISKASRRPGKTGGREGGEADFGLLCFPETLSRWLPPWIPKQKQSNLAPDFSWSPIGWGRLKKQPGLRRNGNRRRPNGSFAIARCACGARNHSSRQRGRISGRLASCSPKSVAIKITHWIIFAGE